ncbi:MAG: hypothetical protein FWG45_04655 [Oscillospiraceae bacterium]|nr:hypothetical protein [Oscillospiraceae bacterium]
MDKMLQMASCNLGIPADELKTMLSKGDINAIMSKMDGKDAQKLKDALANPATMKNFKNSPEMQKYMNENQK